MRTRVHELGRVQVQLHQQVYADEAEVEQDIVYFVLDRHFVVCIVFDVLDPLQEVVWSNEVQNDLKDQELPLSSADNGVELGELLDLLVPP